MTSKEFLDFMNPLMAMVGWGLLLILSAFALFCVLGFIEESYRAIKQRAKRLDYDQRFDSRS